MNYDFKVYTVGWYVEAQGARKDPFLRAFEGLSANELATSNDFYDVMTKNSQYDRTIFIKLAMALQTDLMIRGLVEELQISPKNSVSRLYPENVLTRILSFVCHPYSRNPLHT